MNMTNEMFRVLMDKISTYMGYKYVLTDEDEYGIFHNAICEEIGSRVFYNEGFPFFVKEEPMDNIYIRESAFRKLMEDIDENQNFVLAKSKANRLLWQMGSFLYKEECKQRIIGETEDFKIIVFVDVDVNGKDVLFFDVERRYEGIKAFSSFSSKDSNYIDLLKNATNAKFDIDNFDYLRLEEK